jgi:hypothetical protein
MSARSALGGVTPSKLSHKKINLKEQTHVAHREWLSKIDLAWQELELNHNSQCVEIENHLKRNGKYIMQLTGDNQFELNMLARKNYNVQTVNSKV